MDYWEYRYIYLKSRTDEVETINQFLLDMGREGWELVNVIVGSGGSHDILVHGYYFKRRDK